MTREKKFLSPKICTYGDDLTKRWRLEYWEPTHNGESAKRIVKYGKINDGETIEQRYALAYTLMHELNFFPEREKNIFDKVIEFNSIHWRPKTVSAYTTISKSFLKFLGKLTPECAVQETINEYLMYLYRNKISSNTIEKYRKLLYTLYSKAIAQGLCKCNPVQLVKRHKPQPKSYQYFSEQQIESFKNAELSPQLWLGIKLLFYCFIRPGEQRMLKIGDINFEYGFIEICSDISKNRKTQKVSIPGAFLQEIERLKDYPNNYFILSKLGNPGTVPISTKWLNDEHSKVLDKLKIRGHYAFYSWKHTGAVKAVKAGVNIKDLQLQLRHHSLDMVNEYLKNLGVLDSEDLRNKFPTL